MPRDPAPAGARRRGRHLRPGPHRLPARRGDRGEGTVAGLGGPLRRGQPSRGPPVRLAARAARARLARWSCSWSRAATRCSCRWRGPVATGCSARRSTTRPARRSTRWPGSSGSATPAARPSTGRRTGRSPGLRLPPGPARRRVRLLLQRAQDVRGQRGAARTPTPPTADVAASFQQAVVDVLVGQGPCAAAGRGRARRSAWPAGWRPTRCCASAVGAACERGGIAAFLPSRALCTDNAAMVAAAGWWRLEPRGPEPARPRRRPQPAPSPARLTVPARPVGARPRRRPGTAGVAAAAAVARWPAGRYR